VTDAVLQGAEANQLVDRAAEVVLRIANAAVRSFLPPWVAPSSGLILSGGTGARGRGIEAHGKAT
jgi:hypothetical protein